MKHKNIRFKGFPDLLQQISQPPQALYVWGEIPAAPAVAVVGSRQPTSYGAQVTHALASELARAGVVIVSGLAYGVDTIAHRAALEVGGKTIAVLGGGLDRIYPRSNQKLAEQISQNGAVISEYVPDAAPLPFHFPQRNRIIAGLSLGVIVTEANAKSGSLISASYALEQNRIVMAVPGNITSLRSAGPNFLLKMGAAPATSALDVLDLLNIEPAASQTTASTSHKLSDLQQAILSAIEAGHSSTAAISESTKQPITKLTIALSGLEIAGMIRQLQTGEWAIVSPERVANMALKL